MIPEILNFFLNIVPNNTWLAPILFFSFSCIIAKVGQGKF